MPLTRTPCTGYPSPRGELQTLLPTASWYQKTQHTQALNGTMLYLHGEQSEPVQLQSCSMVPHDQWVPLAANKGQMAYVHPSHATVPPPESLKD